MDKVVVPFRARNYDDIGALACGYRFDPPRSVTAEALVDTGATKLYLQTSLIRQLGLQQTGEVNARTMSNRTPST